MCAGNTLIPHPLPKLIVVIRFLKEFKRKRLTLSDQIKAINDFLDVRLTYVAH